MTKHRGRWCVGGGARPIPLLRVFMLVLALYGFLFDFVTPFTPTPIAVVSGKLVPQPSAVAVLVDAPVPLIGDPNLLVEHPFANPAVGPTSVPDLTCKLRC